MRIVLTGASGMLGRNFLKLVAGNPAFHILALQRRPFQDASGDRNITYVQVDFDNSPSLVEKVVEFQPSAIIHLAAAGMKSEELQDWAGFASANSSMCINLVAAAAKIPNCHLIYTSSGLAYIDQGRPLREADPLGSLDPYAASKASNDILIQSAARFHKIPVTILRPFSFTGVGDHCERLFPSVLRAAVENRAFIFRNGSQVRDYCPVEDIADAVLRSLKIPASESDSPREINLGSASSKPLSELVSGVMEELKINVELASESSSQTSGSYMSADISKAKSLLCWEPKTKLSDSLLKLVRMDFPELGNG